jgi:hypothetical protein
MRIPDVGSGDCNNGTADPRLRDRAADAANADPLFGIAALALPVLGAFGTIKA